MLVVGGVSEFDKEGVDLARSALAELPASTEVEYALGVPLPELIELVKRERSETIVLDYSQYRDRDGRPYVPRNVLRAITAVSPAPVYGTAETYFGQGIVAGVTETYTSRGRLAAERLMQLAAGESIPTLSVVTASCVADARMLRKFSLDESRLPEGCEIRFVELSLWREYRWQILGALAVLLFQTALIAGLLIERERRRRAAAQASKATAESGQHRENLAHLVRVHTVGEMSTAIAHEVNQPLAAIKNYAFAAQRWLTQVGGAPKAGELLNKIEEQASRAGDVLHSLRAMVKKHHSSPAKVDIGPLVAETLKLAELQSRVGDIRLESSIATDLPPVFVDRIQIQQVVLNLTRNAIEAMAESGHTGAINVGVARKWARRGRGECRGLRPGNCAGRGPAHFRSLLLDQGERTGRRALDLPRHRRGAWRTPVTHTECRRRKHLPVHAARDERGNLTECWSLFPRSQPSGGGGSRSGAEAPCE